MINDDALTYGECRAAARWVPDHLGAEPALRWSFPCPAHFVAAELLLVLHNESGWAVLCTVPEESKTPIHTVCKQRLSTFRFTP